MAAQLYHCRGWITCSGAPLLGRQCNLCCAIAFVTLPQAEAVVGGRFSVATQLYLRLLGLEHVAETVCGGELLRGISGGQRKRLTSGEQLVGYVVKCSGFALCNTGNCQFGVRVAVRPWRQPRPVSQQRRAARWVWTCDPSW